ncbi:MAG: cyclohydrolase [Pseudomonadota bacterium]
MLDLDHQPSVYELTGHLSPGPKKIPRGFDQDGMTKAGEIILRSSGDNPDRDGVRRTPERFAKAMGHILGGYSKTVAGVIGKGVFDAEGSGLVTVREVEFFSLCEHHMLPFWGRATVSYYPGKKILGLSKIPRIVEVFARRLQVQERITTQIADAIVEAIEPRAVAVRIEAQHMCMMMRGVEKQQSDTVSEIFRGLDNLNPVEQQRILASITKEARS